MGKCPHCGSRNVRRRYREHRRYKWRCRSCNRVFRRPKFAILLWVGAAVVVAVVAACAVPNRAVIEDASNAVSTSVADRAPKMQATIDAGARSAIKTVRVALDSALTPTPVPSPEDNPTPHTKAANTPQPSDTLTDYRFKTNFDFGSIKKPDVDTLQLEIRTHELINEQRVKRGIRPLEHVEEIRLIARSHSEDMALQGYFSHDNLEGLDPTGRGERVGFHCRKDYGAYYSVGLAENIHQSWLSSSTTYKYGVPFHEWNTQEEIAVSAVEGWMTSPGHRQNILKASYDRTGIGVAIAKDGKVYFTQNFC